MAPYTQKLGTSNNINELKEYRLNVLVWDSVAEPLELKPNSFDQVGRCEAGRCGDCCRAHKKSRHWT